jgi:hypothetical protein
MKKKSVHKTNHEIQSANKKIERAEVEKYLDAEEYDEFVDDKLCIFFFIGIIRLSQLAQQKNIDNIQELVKMVKGTNRKSNLRAHLDYVITRQLKKDNRSLHS